MSRLMSDKTRGVLYAAALISGDLPLAERTRILSKHLSPAPGEEIRVDEEAAKEFSEKTSKNGLAYGYITVDPPKGSCFTVTVSVGRDDIEVCKKTVLRWRLEDLDRQKSTLIWTIKTGPNDFGTVIKWRAPYQIAKVINIGKEMGDTNSVPLFIRTCEAVTPDYKNNFSRRIRLTLFNNEQLIIKLPDEDTILPPRAERRPFRELDPEDEKRIKREKEAKEKKEKEDKEKGEHGEGEKKEKADDTPPPPPEPPMDTDNWTIATRRGFEMSVSNFLTDGSTPPGKKGRCRYQYESTEGDPDSGRIECHYSDRFTYFYAPIPCIKYLRLDKK